MKSNETDAIRLAKINQGLLEQVADLEARLDSNKEELASVNKQLEKLTSERSEFVYAISHDLKTPLTGLKLFADLLLGDEQGVDEQDRARYLAIIASEADRLSRLISNMTEFQGICSGNFQWHDQSLDVVNVVKKCVRPFAVLCESKGIDFSYKSAMESLNMVLDKERLERVVYNLLSNALKFTREGTIKIELKMSADSDGFCLSVSDTGLGMSDEQLQKIFESYSGMPAVDKGAGLFVSNYIVAHYQGRIWAESVVGKGSVFYVELPLSKCEHANR